MSHSKRAVEPGNVELTSFSMADLTPENNEENPAVPQPAVVKSKPQDSVQGVYK
jgi:hypothetical protein